MTSVTGDCKSDHPPAYKYFHHREEACSDAYIGKLWVAKRPNDSQNRSAATGSGLRGRRNNRDCFEGQTDTYWSIGIA
jgi:hypothetical protein